MKKMKKMKKIKKMKKMKKKKKLYKIIKKKQKRFLFKFFRPKVFFSSIFDLVWLFRHFLLFFHQKSTKNESIIKIKASNFGKDKVAQIVLSCIVMSPKNSN